MCMNTTETKLYLAGSDSAVKILDMNIDISETKFEAHKGKILDLKMVDT